MLMAPRHRDVLNSSLDLTAIVGLELPKLGQLYAGFFLCPFDRLGVWKSKAVLNPFLSQFWQSRSFLKKVSLGFVSVHELLLKNLGGVGFQE